MKTRSISISISLGQKNLKKLSKNIWVKKVRNFGYNKTCVPKNIWVKRSFVPKKMLVHKNRAIQKLGFKSLVEIRPVKAEILLEIIRSQNLVKSRSVTAEIMLIWTDVVRTYVA